jgi:hypothetical protein
MLQPHVYFRIGAIHQSELDFSAERAHFDQRATVVAAASNQSAAGEKVLEQALTKLALSARACILKLGRTIDDGGC